jgi:replicative DNA helicase
MDHNEICSRLLAAGSHTPVKTMFGKNIRGEQKERVDRYIIDRQGTPLTVVDRPYITVEQIVSQCRVRRPRIIFVDYTQLVAPTNNKLVREQQVAHITRSLKVAAKHLQMVVIVASQLKRPDKDEKPPTISDLRESGAAEQDADIVLLLNRLDAQRVHMIVGKNRNGPTGTITLRFRGELARVG